MAQLPPMRKPEGCLGSSKKLRLGYGHQPGPKEKKKNLAAFKKIHFLHFHFLIGEMEGLNEIIKFRLVLTC